MANLEVVREFPTKGIPNVKRGRVGNIRNFTKQQYADALKDGAVYVGRPTEWGNKFVLPNEEARFEAIRDYHRWVFAKQQMAFRNKVRQELAGKDLICWCAPKWCHADLLASLATTPVEVEEE